MTVEERAKKIVEDWRNNEKALMSDRPRGGGFRHAPMAPEEWSARLEEQIAQALRDQIEEDAKVIDDKIKDWEHSIRTIKHFTGTYEEIELMQEMAQSIRALAEQKEEVKNS